MTIQKLIFALMLCALSASCAKPALKPTSLPKQKPPEGVITAETLRDSLFLKEVSSIKSEVSVQAFRNGETLGTFSGILAYRAPDALNLRIFGPLGLTVADLVMNGRLLQVYIPLRNTLYEGEIAGLAEFKTRKDLLYAIEELKDGYVLYMFRQIPESAELEILGRYVFSDKTSPINTGAILFKNRKPAVDISLDDFASGLPMTLKIKSGGTDLILHLIEPEINAEISEEFFKAKDHEDKEVRPLKELSGKTP